MKKAILTALLATVLGATAASAQTFDSLIKSAHLRIDVTGGSFGEVSGKNAALDGVLVAPGWVLTKKSDLPGGTTKVTGFFTDTHDYVHKVQLKNNGVKSTATFAINRNSNQWYGKYDLSKSTAPKDDLALLDISPWGLSQEFKSNLNLAFIPKIMLFEEAYDANGNAVVSQDLKNFFPKADDSRKKVHTQAKGANSGKTCYVDGNNDYCYVDGFSGIDKGGAMYIKSPHTGKPVLVFIQHNRNKFTDDEATVIPLAAAYKMQELTKRGVKFVNSKFQQVIIHQDISKTGKVSYKLIPVTGVSLASVDAQDLHNSPLYKNINSGRLAEVETKAQAVRNQI
ncbi:hypothetical protein AAIR98_000392 [Elusimicrobium simillimum]|uniref:hypothetical protein n=1 Tax=Elusimicrobium simillimum TaxID=3143438 RepID=UPI003C6F8475